VRPFRFDLSKANEPFYPVLPASKRSAGNPLSRLGDGHTQLIVSPFDPTDISVKIQVRLLIDALPLTTLC
jgi:hypothetical protein